MDKDAEREEAKKVIEMILLSHPGCGMMVVDIASAVNADYPLEKRLRLYKLIYEMALEGRLWIGRDRDVHSFYTTLSSTRLHELLNPLKQFVNISEEDSETLNEEFTSYQFDSSKSSRNFEKFLQQIKELKEKIDEDKKEP
jgi:hypothetical protein